MTINRRAFNAALLGAMVVPWNALTAVPATSPPVAPVRGVLSISAILLASFDDVLAEKRNGRPFVSDQLNGMVRTGQVSIRPLGTCVDFVCADGGKVRADTLQAQVPLIWSKWDEEHNPTEENKIALVASLLTNWFESMDDLLTLHIGTGRAVVSDVYRYKMGQVMEVQESGHHCVKLYTVFASEQTPDESHTYAKGV